MPTILALASYFKGNEFLRRCRQEGGTVHLLTAESAIKEPWARDACENVLTVRNFHDRHELVNAVARLMRSHRIDRIVALDDSDVEVAAHLREHFRITDTGPGASTARLFVDKLAMRVRARELGVPIAEFTPLFNHDAVRRFLADVPGPWLVKPRSEASAAGIRVLHHPDDVWRRVEEFGDDQSFHLIERMVPGDLFHVDSLVADNRVVFAEVNAYRRPLHEVYRGGGIYATRTVPRDHPEVAALRDANARVLTGFGLGHGPAHTEFLRSTADGQFYLTETSARVGGAETAALVEHATGVDLWGEWARLECRPDGYAPPPALGRYAGVVISLARQEHPDTSAFADPEIVRRLDLKHHIGFVIAADTHDRVEELLTAYIDRIARDYHAAFPVADARSP